MNEKTTTSSAIFILGIMPRSGTNFLSNLLEKHPDCEKSVIAEDFFLQGIDHLLQYGDSFKKIWDTDKHVGGYPGYGNFLLENLGEGLIRFLQQAKEKAYIEANIPLPISVKKKLLVTKTPQVRNIESFFKFFPNEKLIIIVRDGRTLVESIVKSFNFDIDASIRKWVLASQKIIRFEENQKSNKYILIKYEDLYANCANEMLKVLNFLDLDTEKYDFEAALDLPVVGSSSFMRGDGDIHWRPVKKTEEFKPLERSANWTRAQHERFNWLAKKELIYFGYEPKEFEGYKFFWKLRNHLMDFRTGIKKKYIRLRNLNMKIKLQIK